MEGLLSSPESEERGKQVPQNFGIFLPDYLASHLKTT